MAKKPALVYICSSCAYESTRWLGQCPQCQSWNSFQEIMPTKDEMVLHDTIQVVNLADLKREKVVRLSSGFVELDRVLGGGMVPAEVILVSGEPGIGKSTLLLQVLAHFTATGRKGVYVSAEESIQQVGLRADRIVQKQKEELTIISAFDIDGILQKLKELKPELLIIDSIQTVYSTEANGLPGSISQIRAVASKIVNFAKQNNIVTIIVGQITKDGNVAGPKLLEHLVDVVMNLEGDEKRGFRVLRSQKNRYGSISEVGLFEMTDKGMTEVGDASLYFLQDVNERRIGVCPAAVLEGNRVLILEVQALTVATPFSLPKRVTEGISKSKLELLAAIISKYGRVNLSDKDIYINIAGGIKVKDPALDLAVALAILSSVKEKPLPDHTVAYGEVALTGRIRTVSRAEMRAKEVKRLGYKVFDQVYKDIHDIGALTRAIVS